MRIDLPGCSFKNCKYCSDCNCIKEQNPDLYLIHQIIKTAMKEMVGEECCVKINAVALVNITVLTQT